jgi:hypothetical protein
VNGTLSTPFGFVRRCDDATGLSLKDVQGDANMYFAFNEVMNATANGLQARNLNKCTLADCKRLQQFSLEMLQPKLISYKIWLTQFII